ncbi:retrovirus-related pol polyprotein from transposon TNT 1-94 [Tanacetum coccineum]
MYPIRFHFLYMLSYTYTLQPFKRPLRCQLDTDGEMCMFSLTEELHQFERLDVWELVDIPLCKNVINMKWLWKNKRDEENTVIRNKARFVTKGYGQEEGIDFEESFALVARLGSSQEIHCKFTSISQMVLKIHIILTKSTDSRRHYMDSSKLQERVLWMRTQLTDYGFHFDKIPMYCDSKAAIAISCNPVEHSRTKHIDVRYHFIKEQVERGIVELFFVGTEYQLADLFTKALSKDRFKYLVRRLGMRCLTPVELEALANESA